MRDAVVADLEDNFAAETWAKPWVRENAKGERYTLRRVDGGLTLSIVRTQAGQWRLTPARALETKAS